MIPPPLAPRSGERVRAQGPSLYGDARRAISLPPSRKHPRPKSSKFGTLSNVTGWLSEGCLPVPWTYPRNPFVCTVDAMAVQPFAITGPYVADDSTPVRTPHAIP